MMFHNKNIYFDLTGGTIRMMPLSFFKMAFSVAAKPNLASTKEIIRPGLFASAFSHFPRDRFADGAVPGQCFRVDTQKSLFGGVGVGDQARQQDGGCARDVGHAMSNGAAGAGFGEREGLLALRQLADYDGFQLLVVHAIDVQVEQLLNDGLSFVNELPGLRPAGGKADIDLAQARAIAQLQSGCDGVFERAGDLLLDHRLADTGRSQGAANKGICQGQDATEQWRDGVSEHRPQFTGRSRQHDQPTGLTARTEGVGPDFHSQPWCGAVRVVEDERAIGNQGLDAGPLGHGPFAAREELLDMAKHRRILAQILPKQLRYQVAGDIVRSRAEPAGGDDKVGPDEGFADGLLDVAAGVRHGDLAGDNAAQIRQLAAEPLLMRIEHATAHQFGAGVDEFDDHCPVVSGRRLPLTSSLYCPNR